MATKGARNYRPKFHYTPVKGWINDPNGLVFDGEKYHLFAQHYPGDAKWGPMHWAHAISGDMLHWEHLPIALYPDGLGMCFSGSACMKDGKIALMYTSHGDVECQSAAFTDDGVNFTPYAGNPVIANPGLKDYRDPKLFWNEQKNKYGVAIAAGDHVEFFASDDLKSWEKTGEFSDQEKVTGIHECPDVFFLTAPDGSAVSVMIASMISPYGGNRTQYVLGDFDGCSYKITHPFPAHEWIDAGWDDYAPVTFWGAREHIMMGWASNWKYADRLPTGDFAGCMTFPRRLGLKGTTVGLRITQEPLISSITGEYARTDRLPGESFRIRLRAEGDFTLTLKNSRGERLSVGLKDGEYYVDRRLSGECGDAPELLTDYGVARRARYAEGAVEMDITFDVSMLEAFADKGTWFAAMWAFPTAPYETVVGENCTFEIAELK
jgi:fructan beta-fructosidase